LPSPIDKAVNTATVQPVITHIHTHTHTHTRPFVRDYRVNWCQKGKTNVDFNEARDNEWQWHQLGHMQVCKAVQTDNHASRCHPTNSVKALKAIHCVNLVLVNNCCIIFCDVDSSSSVTIFLYCCEIILEGGTESLTDICIRRICTRTHVDSHGAKEQCIRWRQ